MGGGRGRKDAGLRPGGRADRRHRLPGNRTGGADARDDDRIGVARQARKRVTAAERVYAGRRHPSAIITAAA